MNIKKLFRKAVIEEFLLLSEKRLLLAILNELRAINEANLVDRPYIAFDG